MRVWWALVSIGDELVHAANDRVAAPHAVAHVVVVSNVAEDDHGAEEVRVAR